MRTSDATMTGGERMPTDAYFGRWLDITLTNRDMTARKLAKRIGVHDSAVSRWRSGQGRPGMDTCYKLATELKVDPLRLAVTAGLLAPDVACAEPLPLPPAHVLRERVRDQIRSIKGLTDDEIDILLATYDREVSSNGTS